MENVSVYVKVDKYKELVETLKAINTRLANVDKTIDRINSLKTKEDTQLKQWTESLTDIKGRLDKINQAFYDG